MKAHSIGTDTTTTADGPSGEPATAPSRKRKRAQTDTDEDIAGPGPVAGASLPTSDDRSDYIEGPSAYRPPHKVKAESAGYVSQRGSLEDATHDNAGEVLDQGDHVDNGLDNAFEDIEMDEPVLPQVKAEPQ